MRAVNDITHPTYAKTPRRSAPAGRLGCTAPSSGRSPASSSDADRTRTGTTGRGSGPWGASGGAVNPAEGQVGGRPHKSPPASVAKTGRPMSRALTRYTATRYLHGHITCPMPQHRAQAQKNRKAPAALRRGPPIMNNAADPVLGGGCHTDPASSSDRVFTPERGGIRIGSRYLRGVFAAGPRPSTNRPTPLA